MARPARLFSITTSTDAGPGTPLYVKGASGVAEALGLSKAYVSMAITMGRLDKLTRTIAERTTVVEEVFVG